MAGEHAGDACMVRPWHDRLTHRSHPRRSWSGLTAPCRRSEVRQVSGLGAGRSHMTGWPSARPFPDTHHRHPVGSYKRSFPIPSRGGSGFSPDSLFSTRLPDVVAANRSPHSIEFVWLNVNSERTGSVEWPSPPVAILSKSTTILTTESQVGGDSRVRFTRTIVPYA